MNEKAIKCGSWTPLEHLLAFLLALFLVIGAKIQELNIQPLIGKVNDLWFKSYTPLFQGLENIDSHEIYSPLYRKKKKIVIFGASAAESLGCDSTWHHPDKTRVPQSNASFQCSITNQLNLLLQKQGYFGWRAFNLARNGGKITSSLYLYSRVLKLKPEIVIFADSGGYYQWSNGGAGEITPAHYSFIDATVKLDKVARETWERFVRTQEARGFKREPYADRPPKQYPLFVQREKTSTIEILERVFESAQSFSLYEQGPPLPPQFTPFVPNGGEMPEKILEHDKEYGIFQATTIFSQLQKTHHGESLMVFLPRYDISGPHRRDKWDEIFGSYVLAHGGHYSSELLDLDLDAGRETYDGGHQTLYGNRKIAAGILKILKDQNIIQ